MYDKKRLFFHLTRFLKVSVFIFVLLSFVSFFSCKEDDPVIDEKHFWMVGTVNNNSLVNAIPFVHQGDDIFFWQGHLPAGTVRFNSDSTPTHGGIWYGPQANGTIPPSGTTVSMFHNNFSWNINSPGTYTILADVPAMQVRFNLIQGGELPPKDGEQLWLYGTVNNFSLANPLRFTEQEKNIYIWEGNLPQGSVRFSTDGILTHGGNWFGPQTNGTEPALDSFIPMHATSFYWNITRSGNYTITANVTNMTVRFVRNSGGSNPVEPHEKGRYGNYYVIFVNSFYDSTGNGMGDFRGLLQKIDYLNDNNPNSTTSLGIDGIWLLPINPARSYHGYDVNDYKAIRTNLGTMKDFEDFIAACDERGIRVILDLVVNHTSTAHSWFTQARNNNPIYKAYYNVSNVRINNNDWFRLGTFTPAAYYEASFWDQMPDLNYDNPAVKTEMESIIEFWIDKGVSGFRLDAVKHVYENYNGNNKWSDHNKNVEWLRWFTNFSRSKKSDVFIVGEVWEWDMNTIRQYYSSGVPANFNFYAGQDRIQRFAGGQVPAHDFARHVVDWNAGIRQGNSDAIDAPFMGNHDISRFASRIATGTNTINLKMAASMLILMPGNPFIYYGEELGMTGTIPADQNARGPMRWSRNNRTGETTGPSGNTQPYWDASSVEEQLTDQNSILRHYIEALKLKNLYPQIHWGTPSLITTSSTNEIAAYRIASGRPGETDVAVVHNLSNSSRTVTITGAAALGGTLNATSVTAVKPSLTGSSLTMPAFSTAIIEY